MEDNKSEKKEEYEENETNIDSEKKEEYQNGKCIESMKSENKVIGHEENKSEEIIESN